MRAETLSYSQSPTQSDAPIKNNPPARTVVPGSEHKLNRANFEASQPKTIAPEIRVMIDMSVLNASKCSISGTENTLQRRDSLVGETITTCYTASAFNEFLA